MAFTWIMRLPETKNTTQTLLASLQKQMHACSVSFRHVREIRPRSAKQKSLSCVCSSPSHLRNMKSSLSKNINCLDIDDPVWVRRKLRNSLKRGVTGSQPPPMQSPYQRPQSGARLSLWHKVWDLTSQRHILVAFRLPLGKKLYAIMST